MIEKMITRNKLEEKLLGDEDLCSLVSFKVFEKILAKIL